MKIGDIVKFRYGGTIVMGTVINLKYGRFITVLRSDNCGWVVREDAFQNYNNSYSKYLGKSKGWYLMLSELI